MKKISVNYLEKGKKEMPQKYLRKQIQIQIYIRTKNDLSLKSRLFDFDARNTY